jgi:hypothetical protein
MSCSCCDCDDEPLTPYGIVDEAMAQGISFATEGFRKELERAIKSGDVKHALLLVSRLEWTRGISNADNEYKKWMIERDRARYEEMERRREAEVGTWVI